MQENNHLVEFVFHILGPTTQQKQNSVLAIGGRYISIGEDHGYTVNISFDASIEPNGSPFFFVNIVYLYCFLQQA